MRSPAARSPALPVSRRRPASRPTCSRRAASLSSSPRVLVPVPVICSPSLRKLRGRRPSRPGGPLGSSAMAASVDVDRLEVRLLRDGAQPPARSRPGDAGYDLRAVEPFFLAPGARATVGTGVAIALPPGVAGLVVPRSGLAARCGLSVVNGPGLIDPNYRGEIRVVLVNLGEHPFLAEPGDRIAQLLLVPFVAPDLRLVDELPPSDDDRGENGFGSSGR